MNNTIIGIIVGLIVVGGGAFVLMSGGDYEDATEQENKQSEAEVMSEGEEESFTGNLAGLFGLGRSMMCTFTQNDDYAEGSGTVYVADDKMRADYSMMVKAGGGRMEGSSIVKDDTVYAWGSTPFGEFASKHSQIEEVEADEKDSQGFDFDEEVDYECKKWNVDNSKFNPPSDIEFVDINAQMEQMMGNIDMIEGLDCSACDAIPDENAKAQCLAAIGC